MELKMLPGIQFRLLSFCLAVLIAFASCGQVVKATCDPQESTPETVDQSAKRAQPEDSATEDQNEATLSRQEDAESISQAVVEDINVSVESTARAASFNAEETFFGGITPQTLEELRELERRFAEITEMVKPATVNIQTGGSQGSGVVVTRDGFILTAAHVIGAPNGKATVTFPDKKRYTATTLGVANQLDSGLLKIDAEQGDEFPYLEMGLSSELKKGQWVLALGHPGGIDEKRGLVVRAGRVLNASERVIQTDCTLVGGDSGGPLVNLNGEVVGIHSRIGMNLWDNLHVPVDAYSEKWDQMLEGLVLDGQPILGFKIEKDSVIIEEITVGGAAESAGLKVGDIVKKIHKTAVENSADLQKARRDLLPNMKIKVVVLRGEEELTLDLVVGPVRR